MVRSYLHWAVLVLLGGCSVLVDLAETDNRDGGALDASYIDGSGAAADAPISPADASSSTEACSNVLMDGTCVINCTSSSCDGDIVCPEGRPCVVNCVGALACETAAIDCENASSCVISCEGDDACDTGGILCGGTSCSVSCIGSAACEEGLVDCQADTCSLRCEGGNACAVGACCRGGQCAGSECTSVSGGNCDCPL